MVCILASILSLTQHLLTLKNSPEKYFINQCPHSNCGKAGLWGHGFRHRKTDREHTEQITLNPIPIRRLYCPNCKRTCSVLPECIPPLRWYLWLIQQEALTLYFAGKSLNKISQQIKPSRWTISRWLKRLNEKFKEYAFHLKSTWSDLGYHEQFDDFWTATLNKMSLSQAMVFLNNQKVFVP
jgi:transposase-like protein